MWNTDEDPAADCLNDLHSSNNELCQIFAEDDFRAYNDNSFRFKTTENPEFQLTLDCLSGFTDLALLEVSFFTQNGYSSRSRPGHIEIMNVTARKLMQLAAAVRQHVS